MDGLDLLLGHCEFHLVIAVGLRVLEVALLQVLRQLLLRGFGQRLALAVERVLPVDAVLPTVRAVQLCKGQGPWSNPAHPTPLECISQLCVLRHLPYPRRSS